MTSHDSDDEEELIAAFGKNAARKNTRYSAQGAKPKSKKTNRPPLTAKKIREREERRKKAVCHWCKETGHYVGNDSALSMCSVTYNSFAGKE